ncbi:hypothetical protein L1049_003172 [Liquidambar formosana]|uniref:Uncharacterized protein n=1 Tax=Liquidambar formosana TaxID=63359 RepID=A0AAP0NM01_LIQFO
MPMATAPPVLIPPVSVDFPFVVIFGPELVVLAVGFSVGTEGKGEVVGVPAAGELLGGAGGAEEDEGTEGGGDGDVDLEGEFVEGRRSRLRTRWRRRLKA